MKIHRFVLFISVLGKLSAETATKLYKIAGTEQTGEFSSEEAKKHVEDDVRQFESLGTYKEESFATMDMSDKMAGVKITQQILRQGDKRGAMDFFKIPEEAKNSEEMNKLGHINFENFYDYETNSYIQKFNTPEAQKSMKKLHIDYFTKQESTGSSVSAFFQQEEKNFSERPKALPRDYKSSFLATENKNKIFPLLHLWEYLDLKNCWASSRYEFGFIFTLYFYLPVLKWFWFIPYFALKRYTY